MPDYVLDFHEIDRTQVSVVGGKGANLGELSRIEGIRVPPGFCVTTRAFRRVIAPALLRLKSDDVTSIRQTIEQIAIPDDVAVEVTLAIHLLGEQGSYAVRSSATAEDSTIASFAGQHDTFLNVVGPAAVIEHIRRCWASLFSDRAVAYRMRNGLDHRKAEMAVVVQRMVVPQVSGVMFTADPVTSNRRVASVEATHGLGEGLVSGQVNPDLHKVRDGEVIASVARQDRPALSDAQLLLLVDLGRKIEAHFGRPQDIEWCLVDGEFEIVQSRPITTLFPIPAVDNRENHVFMSVGHQQMMTDAIKPLGISVWQLTALRPMFHAGGRLFVDVTRELASPASRASLVGLVVRSDPLTGDAITNLLERENFIAPLPDVEPVARPAGDATAQLETDPAIVADLIERTQLSIAALKREISNQSGAGLLDFILADLEQLKRLLLDPRSVQAIRAGMEATWWLNDNLESWLGEKNAADSLSQSAPNNVTSEMGLALLDVADAVRPHPEVVSYLLHVEAGDLLDLDVLTKFPGGTEARDAIRAYLDMYGMRCVGEIDITRPRWSERPATLVPVILGNVRNFAPGEARRHFERGLQDAQAKEREVLERLRALPDGGQKVERTKDMIDRLRTFIGFREYPKYGIVSRYFVYKQALLGEADRLIRDGVLRDKEDIFYLTFQELQEVVRTRHADDDLIRRRMDEFRSYQALTPPRVLTSDGEVVAGSYRREHLPAGALAGLPVSAGIAEGRARVIHDLAEADLQPGDILVTAYTDPSWSPLFVTIAGLVTEVGGLMTHGAVIAREYGLPAVVGVENATGLIRDGQRIRVHGTEGYVELLAAT